MTDLSTTLRHLPMSPTKLFGKIMEASNRAAYLSALKAVSLHEVGAFLEIGFGSGKLLELAHRKWPEARICGIDPTPEMVALALSRKAFSKIAIRLDIRLGSAEQIPWASGSFEIVVAVNSFQFWSPPELAMQEIWRVLKVGGQVVLVLRDHDKHAPDWLPNPISRSGHEVNGAMRLLIDADFENVKVEGSKSGQKHLLGTKN